MVYPFVNPEAHEFVKSFCLRVLFIYGHPPDVVVFDSIPDQAFSHSFAAFFRGNEQHGLCFVTDSHKGHGATRTVFRDQQMGDSVQCLRDMFFDVVDFAVRQKPVCRYSGGIVSGQCCVWGNGMRAGDCVMRLG